MKLVVLPLHILQCELRFMVTIMEIIVESINGMVTLTKQLGFTRFIKANKLV